MSYQDPPSSPFDPSVPDWEPQTIPLDEIIRRADRAAAMNLRVSSPAKVVAVNGNQNVDIQLLVQGRLQTGQVFTFPVIHQVPVQMPGGQNWFFKFPIAVGDLGNAIMSDRSLEVFLAGYGEIADPQDTRAHDISDAVFFPGLVPFSQQTKDETDDLIIQNGEYLIRFATDKISIGKGETVYTAVLGEPLVMILQSIVSQFNDHVHTGNLGAPTTPPTVPMDVPDLDNNKLLCDDGGGF